MIRYILLFLFVLTTLTARENPFFAAKGEKDIPFTSNEIRTKTPLKRATITLPKQARVLQKVTLEFQNLDGSLETKSIDLDKSIDWHLPVFISQSYQEDNYLTPINKIKAEKPHKIVKKMQNYKKIASIKYVDFYSYGKSLKIDTKDKIVRNFMLVNPHRIVIDFKRNSNMKSYSKEIEKNIFKKIRVGNHDGYYRAVIELDGIYGYNLIETDIGYLISLN